MSSTPGERPAPRSPRALPRSPQAPIAPDQPFPRPCTRRWNRRNLGVLGEKALPARREVSLAPRKPFSVRAHGEDHGHALVQFGTEYVGTQDESVGHRHGDVTLDRARLTDPRGRVDPHVLRADVSSGLACRSFTRFTKCTRSSKCSPRPSRGSPRRTTVLGSASNGYELGRTGAIRRCVEATRNPRPSPTRVARSGNPGRPRCRGFRRRPATTGVRTRLGRRTCAARMGGS